MRSTPDDETGGMHAGTTRAHAHRRARGDYGLRLRCSLPYVARWSGGDLDVVRSTADSVVGAARRIPDDLGIGKPESDAVATNSA